MQCRRPRLDSWVRKIPWRRDRLPTPVSLGFPDGSAGKESACNVETLACYLGWEDPLEERKATHSSIFAWRIPPTVKSRTRLSSFRFHFFLVDIWGWVIFCCRGFPAHCRMFSSNGGWYSLSVPLPLGVTTKSICRHCRMPPKGKPSSRPTENPG